MATCNKAMTQSSRPRALTGVDNALAHLSVAEGHAMPGDKLPQHVAGQLAVGASPYNHDGMLGTLRRHLIVSWPTA